VSGRAVGGLRGLDVFGRPRDAGLMVEGRAAGSETEDEGGRLLLS